MKPDDRSCGNCAARQEAGGHMTCHRHPPPWEHVAADWWCFQWLPETRLGEGIVVTEKDVDAAMDGLTDRRIAAAVIAIERRLDRGGV